MATYRASNYRQPSMGHGLGGNMKVCYFAVTATAALTTDDVLQFGYVPENFRVVGAALEADDLDTSGSPAITLHVGDSGDADRLFASSTVGQAGTAGVASVASGIFYKYTSATLITGACAVAPGTGVSGEIRLAVFGFIEDDTTS